MAADELAWARGGVLASGIGLIVIVVIARCCAGWGNAQSLAVGRFRGGCGQSCRFGSALGRSFTAPSPGLTRRLPRRVAHANLLTVMLAGAAAGMGAPDINASRSAGAIRRRPKTNADRNAPVSIARCKERRERPEANFASSKLYEIFAGQLVDDICRTFLVARRPARRRWCPARLRSSRKKALAVRHDGRACVVDNEGEAPHGAACGLCRRRRVFRTLRQFGLAQRNDDAVTANDRLRAVSDDRFQFVKRYAVLDASFVRASDSTRHSCGSPLARRLIALGVETPSERVKIHFGIREWLAGVAPGDDSTAKDFEARIVLTARHDVERRAGEIILVEDDAIQNAIIGDEFTERGGIVAAGLAVLGAVATLFIDVTLRTPGLAAALRAAEFEAARIAR